MRKTIRLFSLTALLGATLVTGIARWTILRQHEAWLTHASETELRAVTRRDPGDSAALYCLALARQKAGATMESEQLLEASLKADPTRAVTWLALATLTESKGDAAHAEQILKEMRKRFPDNAVADVRLANLLLARDAPTAAHSLAELATTQTPGDAEAWIALARSCLSLDRLPEAETALDRAERLQPNAWQIAFTRGDLSMTRSSFSEAATHYRRATVLVPREPLPQLALAHSLVRGSDPTASELREAETCLQNAAALKDTVPLYPHIVAKLRMRQKRWTEALEPLAAARFRNPADAEIVFDQSIALQALGRTADAEAARNLHLTLVTARQQRRVILTELARNPEQSKKRELCRELAHLYQTQGLFWESRRTLEGLLGLDEGDSTVREEIAVLDHDPRMTAQRLTSLPEAALIAEGNSLLTQEHYVEAQLRFQEAVRRNASDAIAVQGIGISLFHQGRALQAVPYFTQATDLAPGLIASQFYLGQRALDFGLVQEAIRRLEKASRLAPDDPQVWYLYYQALVQMPSRLNDQIAALRKCVSLTPDNPTYRMELGEVLVDAGKLDDAEVAFRKAVALAPDSVETQARLGGFLTNSRTSTSYSEAAALLNRARDMDPRHVYTRFCLGTLALKQGRAEEAVTLLRSVADESPRMQESWYLLARAYAAVGKASESRDASLRSRRIQADSVEFQAAQEKLYDDVRDPVQRLKVAQLCQKFNQPLKAMAHYRILLSQRPNYPEALREKAVLERRLAQDGQTENFAAYEEMLRAGTRATERNARK